MFIIFYLEVTFFGFGVGVSFFFCVEVLILFRFERRDLVEVEERCVLRMRFCLVVYCGRGSSVL